MSSAAPGPTAPPGGSSASPVRGPRWAFPRGSRQPAQPSSQFSGQQQGEKVIFLKHKHWWFLIKPGWPAIGLLALLIGIITAHILLPHYSAFWIILEAVVGVAFLTFLLRWAYSEVSDWWYTTYILTDKRLIVTHGWLQPQRKEAPLDKIQQVYMDVRNIWKYLLDFGDVILPTSAGPIQLTGIAHPRTIVDEVIEAMGQYNTSHKAAPDANVKDETLRKVIDELAKPTVIAAPPSPDPAPKPGSIIAPGRRFGGPLHLTSRMRYGPDERTIQYIQRHPYVFFRRAAPGALIILVMIVLALVLHFFLWPIFVVGTIVGLGWVGYSYINYIDDVYILTTHRIVDIDRAAFIFFEGRSIVEYGKIQDIIVEIPSPVARLFDFGDVRVQTAGQQQKIHMRDVPDPFAIQTLISQRINAGKERETVNAANKQKAEMKKWFADVLNAMYDLRAPDLIGKSFEEASDILSNQHMKLRVLGEQRVPGIPPGHVVNQTPPPGTMLGHEAQVHIILSKL